MELAINIVKEILLPHLRKDSCFDNDKITASFLETFAIALITLENDQKTLNALIYSLELEDAERIISKVPILLNTLIKELAEQYVLGNENMLTDKLKETKNESFSNEVSFLSVMKAVITKSERQQLKKSLPLSHERLTFELDEKKIEAVAKKKSREDLRAKFKQWDEDVSQEESVLIESSLSDKDEENKTKVELEKGKVISLSWIKYAAAACVVLAAGIMYYQFNTSNNLVQPVDSTVVTAPVKKDTISKGTIIPKLPIEALAEVAIITKTYPVMESGLGMATNTINIVENNQNARKVSIIKAIENYQKLLENEFADSKVGYDSRIKEVDSKILSLQKELTLLKNKEKQYVFDGKVLVLYVSAAAKDKSIILYEESYYLKKDAAFFKLSIASQPQFYKKEIDSVVLNELEKI
jgi:hypothetical protein